MKTSAIVSLRYVVSSVLNEKMEDDRNYERYLQLAIEGFTELNIGSTKNVEVTYKTVPEINMVDLPNDCIDITVLGRVQGNRIFTLTREDLIPLPRTEECGESTNPYKSKSVSDSDLIYTFSDHYAYGNYVPALYGYSGGANDAYYRIDWERRKIILQGSVPGDEIVIEYISSGVNMSGSTQIPRQWVETLKRYVHWKSIEYDSTFPMGEKERKRNQYWDERRKAHAFEWSFTLDEYLDTKYAEYKQTPKR